MKRVGLLNEYDSVDDDVDCDIACSGGPYSYIAFSLVWNASAVKSIGKLVNVFFFLRFRRRRRRCRRLHSLVG